MQRENGNESYNRLEPRVVTRWDKVWALTMKDLTIRIFRSPLSALLWTVIPVAVAYLLPIYYFVDHEHGIYNTLKVTDAAAPVAEDYNWYTYIDITFDDKVYDEMKKKLDDCQTYRQSGSWFTFLMPSSKDDNDDDIYKFGWHIDANKKLLLYEMYHAPETTWVWQGFDTWGYADRKGYALQMQILYKCMEDSTSLIKRNLEDFHDVQLLPWDARAWNANESSVRLILICGILWLMVILFSISGFLLHIVNERNSGVKAIMMSMGLDATTYWISQFVSYVIESAPKMILIGAIIGAMISDICDSSSAGGYAFFAFVMSYINTAPFIFTLAPFLTSSKNASAMTNLMKFCFPFIPAIVIIQNVNVESSATRFFMCLIPPINFAMAVRDSVRERYTAEVMFWLFFNFPFWTFLAWYFDLIMPSSSQAAQKKPWFCCTDMCRKKYSLHHSGSQTELFSSVGSNRNSIQVDNSDLNAPELLLDSNILRIENLEKEFGNGVKAVNGLSLSVQENTIYGLLGFNGAGKTTTINMITGILKPTNGDIFISGMSVLSHMDQIRSTLGMCPQHNVMYDQLTVGEHMILFGRLRGMTDESIEQEMGPLLRSVEMEEQKGTLAENLSGGQKRKLCMVQAFLGDPKLILLDEPTSGVDAESRRSMWDFILEKKQGRVIILTTHQMREADVLCDRIGIMSEGELLVEGTPVELKQKYAVGYEIDITHRRDISDVEGPGLKGLMEDVNSRMPEAKVETLPGEWKFQIPSKYSQHISSFIAKIEDLGVASAINVHAATLEAVFLRLASQVDELGHSQALNNNSNYEAPVAVPIVEPNQDGIQPSEQTPQTGSTRPRMMSAESKAKQRSQVRLQGLETDVNRFTRSSYCVRLFKQFVLLFVKRLYVTCIYWGPLFSGLVSVCLLAIIVQFILTMAGLTDSAIALKSDSMGTIAYITNDTSNPSQYYRDHWEGVKGVTLMSAEGLESKLHLPRDRTEQPYLTILDMDDSNRPTIVTSPLYAGYMFLAIQQSYVNEQTFNLGGTPSPGQKEIISSVVLVLGLGLIIGSTWHYVGAEVRDKIYEYQVQTGANPVLIWVTHWIFDLCVNLVLVVIFIAICIRNGHSDLIGYYQWSAFLAFMSYVWIQYIFLYLLKRDRLVENILSWSALIMIGVFVAEGFLLYDGWKNILDVFQTDKWVWENGSFGTKVAWFINYLLPPVQFMVGSGQGSLMWIYKLIGTPDLMDKYHEYHDQYFGTRLLVAFLASCFWAGIFALLHILEKKRADPQAPPQFNAGRANDVLNEKQEVQRIKAEQNPSDYPAILADGLTKNFSKVSGPFRAVDELSFRVSKGECFGLLGKNGAGKSTAINMITTLLAPSIGESYLMGSSNEQAKRDVLGVCPQQDILWKKMTVYQHLTYYGLLKGVPYGQIDSEIKRLGTALTLEPYFNRSTGKLSGGNKRKLMLATALIGAVEVVFMDEPSSGVDPFARKCMMDVIDKYTETRAMVLTTHMMEEVEGICERVGIMVNGDFACVNTINGLINQTNEGYQIEISLGKLQNEQVDEVAQLLETKFEGSRCTERDTLVMAYQIPTAGNKLSMIFEVGNQLYEKYGCESVISQMTMDQLFLKLTRGQRVEDQEDLVATGRAAAQEINLCCWGFGCCPRERCCGC